MSSPTSNIPVVQTNLNQLQQGEGEQFTRLTCPHCGKLHLVELAGDELVLGVTLTCLETQKQWRVEVAEVSGPNAIWETGPGV